MGGAVGNVVKGAGNLYGSAIGGTVGGGFGNAIGGMFNKGGNKDAIMGILNDKSNMPQYPGFHSMVNPSTGFLDDKYNLKSTLDTQALDKIQSQALSSGPSTWAQLQNQNIGTQAGLAKSNAASQSQGATADAMSHLAMKGGLSSGAQERVGQSGIAQNLAAQQGIGAQSDQALQNVALNDEQMKQSALASLPGMQMAKEQYGQNLNQANIGNVLSQNQQEQMAKMAEYQAQMQAYGAQKSAQATALGGGKKG